MARRLRFVIGQPITIIGWYLTSFLLIGLVAATERDLKLPAGDDRALNQAFYYAIMAAALYFIVATLMCFTVYGAWRGYYPKEFELTTSQRTLMLQTIVLLIYLLGGAAVFAHIEGWTFLDAVYWADFTLLTVGIGDYAPVTHLGRGLLFPYAIFGIVFLGLVVGSIRALVLERGKRKLGARILEKNREKVVENINNGAEKLKLTPLSKPHQLTSHGKSERQRRADEFELMRKIQDTAATRRKWISLATSGGAWFFLWFIGALVFYKAERNQNWSYFQSLCEHVSRSTLMNVVLISLDFAYTSLLTIGYGDLRPYSNSGKPFFVFWSLLAVPTLTILISNMGDTVIKAIKDVVLWLGEFTLLPGEGSTRKRIKRGVKRLGVSREDGGKMTGEWKEKAPGFLGDSDLQDPEKQDYNAKLDKTDRLAGALEKDELGQEKEAGDRGDWLDRDIHHYHYLLVKEIRNVMKDLNDSPPRKYSYHEWAWFLRLMGEDENSSRSHRKALAHAPREEGTDPESQTGIDDDDSDHERHQWSWLGTRSPLMVETEEAEWVLERLSETLEKELRKQRDAKRRASPGEDEPAILSPRSNSDDKPSQSSEDSITALSNDHTHPSERV